MNGPQVTNLRTGIDIPDAGFFENSSDHQVSLYGYRFVCAQIQAWNQVLSCCCQKGTALLNLVLTISPAARGCAGKEARKKENKGV